jgi:hypothetical protein
MAKDGAPWPTVWSSPEREGMGKGKRERGVARV